MSKKFGDIMTKKEDHVPIAMRRRTKSSQRCLTFLWRCKHKKIKLKEMKIVIKARVRVVVHECDELGSEAAKIVQDFSASMYKRFAQKDGEKEAGI